MCLCVCVKVHACHKMPLIMLAINFYSLDATAGIQWTVVGLVFVYFFGLGGLLWQVEMGFPEGSHEKNIWFMI